MNITIIGSGNVAEAFAEAICETRGVRLHLNEIYSRNEKRGRELAERYGTKHNNDIRELATSDLYLIAVSDSAIGDISSRLNIPDTAVAAHVSGGMSIDSLYAKIKNKAVIYPLQTFTAGRKVDFRSIPLFIEYTTAASENAVRLFAHALCESVFEADSAKRNRLHIAAVFACNFTNHLYHIASEFVRQDSLPFEILKPLIAETAAKAQTVTDPTTVQTGPAARHDEVTILRHLDILAKEGKKEYYEIYKLLSDNIWETLKKT